MAKKRLKPAPDTEIVSLRLPTDLVRALEERAEADDRSRNRTATRLLRLALAAKQAG